MYFCCMADKTATRMTRAYTFTFDEDGDKQQFAALAKRQNRTLAGLIKHLLAADIAAHPAPTPGPGGAGAA